MKSKVIPSKARAQEGLFIQPGELFSRKPISVERANTLAHSLSLILPDFYNQAGWWTTQTTSTARATLARLMPNDSALLEDLFAMGVIFLGEQTISLTPWTMETAATRPLGDRYKLLASV